MSTFDDIYSALLARRDSPSELPPLTPSGPYRKSLKADIASLQGSSEVVQAALHLLNDDISAAHDLAQAHEESMTANLVHAVLHRREQDYWNSVSGPFPVVSVPVGNQRRDRRSDTGYASHGMPRHGDGRWLMVAKTSLFNQTPSVYIFRLPFPSCTHHASVDRLISVPTPLLHLYVRRSVSSSLKCPPDPC